MNPFEQSKQQLLHSLISQVEQEVIDYIRQEMQHDAPDSVPTEDELLTFFQSPDEATTLNAYQQMLATDKLLEYEGKGYPFTKEQRQEVLRLREELQAPLWMTINRASMIALLRPVPDGKPARCRREFRPKFLIREGIPNTEAVFERKRRIYPFSYRESGRPAGARGTGRRPHGADHLDTARRLVAEQKQ